MTIKLSEDVVQDHFNQIKDLIEEQKRYNSVGDLWYKFIGRTWTTSSNCFVVNTLYLIIYIPWRTQLKENYLADEFRVIRIHCSFDWHFKKDLYWENMQIFTIKTGHSTVVYEVLGRWTSCAGGNFRSTYLPHSLI